MRSAHILLFSLQLLFSRFDFSESLVESLPLVSPTHPCLYICFLSLQVYIEYGSLSAVAIGLNIPLQATVRPIYGNEIGLTTMTATLRVNLTICMRFAWFGCGERSTNLVIPEWKLLLSPRLQI